MTDEREDLDERLAARLHRAADDVPALDPAAQARVVLALQRESTQLRVRRTLRIGLQIAAAAGVLLTLLPWGRAPSLRECALPTDVEFVHEGGRKRLQLGRFGELVTDADAVVRVQQPQRCLLTVELERGSLAAELTTLRPAQLVVKTPLGAVWVHGTTFSVDVQDELEVALLQGAVSVSGPNHGDTALRAGQVLRQRSKVELRDVDARDAERVRTLLHATPPSPQRDVPSVTVDAGAPEPAPETTPPGSATTLLAEAEAARRAGKLELARTRYREAGSLRGGDAEVALLRWTRLELAAAEPKAARRVLARYRQHFGHGKLAAEAAWLEVEALDALGKREAAHAAARALVERFPDSPHADAARTLLAR